MTCREQYSYQLSTLKEFEIKNYSYIWIYTYILRNAGKESWATCYRTGETGKTFPNIIAKDIYICVAVGIHSVTFCQIKNTHTIPLLIIWAWGQTSGSFFPLLLFEIEQSLQGLYPNFHCLLFLNFAMVKKAVIIFSWVPSTVND